MPMPRPLLASLVLGAACISTTQALTLLSRDARPDIEYRAAVAEIVAFPAPDKCTAHTVLHVQMQNVVLIDQWAAQAAASGAQIVVFPEGFVTRNFTAEHLTFVERLPSANSAEATLCDGDPGESPFLGMESWSTKTPIARELACTAKRHNIMIVTGLGDFAPCVSKLSPFTQMPFPCNSSRGLAPFNTVAAFGVDGKMQAKYHKHHLFRTVNAEWEKEYAQPDDTETVVFESHFGVKFGLMICNDLNFPEPTRSLLQAGVRDFIHSSCWWNADTRYIGLEKYDAFSRLHAVNLIAVSCPNVGPFTSSSGIWNANLSEPVAQHLSIQALQNWLGVHNLTSRPSGPTPVLPILPSESDLSVTHKQMGENGTISVQLLYAVAGSTLEQNLTVDGLECKLRAKVNDAGGIYMFSAMAGMKPNGLYSAICGILFCHNSNYADCLHSYQKPDMSKGSPARRGNSFFTSFELETCAPYAIVPRPGVLCKNFEVPQPRTAIQLDILEGKCSRMSLEADTCSNEGGVESAIVSWRKNEPEPMCPHGGCSKTHQLSSVEEVFKKYLEARPWHAPGTADNDNFNLNLLMD